MIIKKVQMHNFGPFHGDHEIRFEGNGRGVHLIRGKNGQGKTSIQRAMLWCLYGRVVDRKGNDIRPTSLLNLTARRDDIYEYWVQIVLEHDGEEWTVTRKTRARTHRDQAYKEGQLLHVVVNGQPLTNTEHEIERLLPYQVHRFFFFDGEMLRDYEELLDQNSRSMALLRSSIEKVLGIPYLRIARDDLFEVQKRIERERNRILRRLGGDEYEELADLSKSVSDEIDQSEGRIRAYEKQISDLDGDLLDIKHFMADIESIRQLAEERIQIEGDIEKWERKRAEETVGLRDLTSHFYKTLLTGPANTIISSLKEKHKAVMEKYDQKQRMIGRESEIERAVASKKCKLCGAVLDKKEVQRLKSDLSEVRLRMKELTEVPEPNLEFEHYVTRLEQMMEQAPSRDSFKDIEKGLNSIDREIARAKSRLSDVKEGLEGVDQEEPRRLAIKLEEMSKEKGRLMGSQEEEKKRLLENKQVKAEIDQRLSSIDQEELEILARRIALARSLAEVLGEAIDRYRDERRSEVEARATEIFKRIRTKESFDRLRINQQFGLNILTKGGEVLDRAEWRSAGEEQIVALSLVGALNKSAQVKAPVFMDTPFGRLDLAHGERVLTFLPSLADQVVLLVTDREFREGDEHLLSGHIKTDYTVVHNGEERGSSLHKTRVAVEAI